MPALQSVNPADNTLVQSYPIHDTEAIAGRLNKAVQAQAAWSALSFDERAVYLNRVAALLREDKQRLAELAALEMGKPVKQGIAEVEKCAWVCEHYAANASTFLGNEPVDTGSKKTFVSFQPLGVVLAIMPWNFPYWQVFRSFAPIVMGGNAYVLKHASNVTGCALAMEELITRAGLPEGIFECLLVPGSEVEPVIKHPAIAAITLTGSTAAGKKVAAAAGSVLKKCVLELGGSDAYVILEDANIAEAAETCVNSRLNNSGQSCVSAKRFVVVEAVREAFEAAMLQQMQSRTYGAPLKGAFNIGPMARVDLRDELHQQVTKSIAAGAQVLCGAEIPAEAGAYYPPSILTDVRKGMPAYDEELFGPVAAIIYAKDEADAIRIANDSIYGLGAAVFTTDLEKGERIAATQLQAGNCFVNGVVRSDPRVPFGGVKESGYGRELGVFGMREFVNIKTVWIDH
jgi:succinate-semialdehyde dehydrogenase/glutarate-semialdehyde dehydrogenase